MINLNALPPPKPNYEMILNNLMKYLKKKIPFEQYCDIRQYVENEIKHPTKSESLSSLFANRTNIATLTNNEKKLKLSFHKGNVIPSAFCILSLFKTEYCGRFAGVGYSSVVHGIISQSLFSIRPNSTPCFLISFANL